VTLPWKVLSIDGIRYSVSYDDEDANDRSLV